MSELEINQPSNLGLFWLVVLIALSALFANRWRRRARNRFASEQMLRTMMSFPTAKLRLLRDVATLVAGALVVLSLIDIRWGEIERELPQKGIEVMFLVDVSKSMLAEDVAPNRLERAKQMIRDTLDEMSGDRVGLTLFAGEARQRIPMTNHYEDFQQTLAEITPDDLATGGSKLGDAIRVAADGFLEQRNDHQAIVVLTDGEDQESNPVDVARQVFEERNVRIFTIGLGDFRQGARVPLGEDEQDGYLQYDGQQVWSKLDGKVLKEVAEVTGGDYIPAGTKLVNMSDFYYGYLSNLEQVEFAKAKFNRKEARYQWFLVPAILLVLFECYWIFPREKLVEQSTLGAES